MIAIKKSIFAIVAILIFANTLVYTQIKLDFSGYVFNLPSYQDIPKNAKLLGLVEDEKYFLMDLTRLRLMPNLELSENSRITLHYELDVLATKVAIPYFTGVGKTNRQAVKLYWNLISENNLIAYHYIDLLYYKQIFDFGEITFGRQLITWGVGRIWQPTDLFNPINPANFSKFEKDGADGISTKIYLGDFSDLELVVNTREQLSKNNYGGRFRTNYNEYDLTINSGYFDERYVLGSSFAGNLLGAGIRGEGIYSFKKDSSYARIIFGADYQFTGKIYALIEYLYNGEGTTCKSCYDIARLFKGEIQNVGVNYLTIQANYLIHPLVNLTVGTMANLNDQSGYITGIGRWSAVENLNLGLGMMFFFGGSLSEYSYYSTSAYLLCQFYF